MADYQPYSYNNGDSSVDAGGVAPTDSVTINRAQAMKAQCDRNLPVWNDFSGGSFSDWQAPEVTAAIAEFNNTNVSAAALINQLAIPYDTMYPNHTDFSRQAAGSANATWVEEVISARRDAENVPEGSRNQIASVCGWAMDNNIMTSEGVESLVQELYATAAGPWEFASRYNGTLYTSKKQCQMLDGTLYSNTTPPIAMQRLISMCLTNGMVGCLRSGTFVSQNAERSPLAVIGSTVGQASSSRSSRHGHGHRSRHGH